MQQHVPLEEERCKTVEQEASATEGKRRKRARGLHHFVHWDREDQRRAFLNWLPVELHDAPGIDWTAISPEIMGYLVKTIGNSPNAAAMAVAAASIRGAIDQSSQYTCIKHIGQLLRSLQTTTSFQCLADLKQEQVWFDWAAKQEKREAARQRLTSYGAIATGHFLRYLRRLTLPEQQRMRAYALPPPPADLSKSCFPYKQTTAPGKQARKAATDILVPLYPVLRQMVRLRKQLAERTLLAVREARRRVEAGEVALPYHFQHTALLPERGPDAKTLAEVRLEGREVTSKKVLWDKNTRGM